MKMLSRVTLWLSLLVAARAQTPSPLLSVQAAEAAVPGKWIVAEGRAYDALQAGFPATAAAGYREILAQAGLPADARQRMTLALVSALLDAGDLGEADRVLQGYDGARGAAYQLRVGLLAATLRRWPQAKAALAASKPEDLSGTDRGWWHFLAAMAAEADNDLSRRDKAYEEADKAAVSELQRARFQLGQEQARLRIEAPTEAQLATYRGNMERFQGTQPGYNWVRTYAAALNRADRKAEALTVLQRQLAFLPLTERNTADQFRLLLGMIAGEDSPTGRKALGELVALGLRPETQRTALYLLARGARTPATREELRRTLGDLIDRSPTIHPIIEDLLLARAHAALADQQYNDADQDASRLLKSFPASPLKAGALGVQLTVAWERGRYRTAVDLITQLRATLPPGREHSELGVLLAEAFFRTGDYQSAGDAYDAALREAPQVVKAGVLIFQRVLSDIKAERLESAVKLLDESAGNPSFDAENRWQAEWNLIKALQVHGQTPAALARVEKLLQRAPEGRELTGELRVRLLWLRAKLSFDNGQHELAIRQVDELLAVLPGAGLEAALRSEVASTGLLVKAQALQQLKRDEEAGKLLDQMRADYKGTKAAVYSYIVQATNYSEKGDTVRAQQLFTKLADDHKDSEFAPLALYYAALCAERRGLEDYLREAYRILEEGLIRKYPNDELVFYARLKQGDLLRKLNDFGAARQIYEDLINNRGQHPDVLLAQLSLADSLFAQGGNSLVNYESASAIYERLRDLPSAPVDLRAEAGFKWGYALAKRGQGAKAQTVFWSVVDAFLLDSTLANKLGPKGRWWVSRTLLELGQLLEDAGRLDEAQRAYQLILDQNLNGAALAKSRLARFRASPAKEQP